MQKKIHAQKGTTIVLPFLLLSHQIGELTVSFFQLWKTTEMSFVLEPVFENSPGNQCMNWQVLVILPNSRYK
jgi:hypothetical protein